MKSFLTVAALAFTASCSLNLQAQTYSGRIGTGASPSIPKAGGTVIVGIAVSDGLVLAADSRLTLTYSINAGYKIASDNASKLFSVGNVGIATYGEAFILGRSINSFVSEFDANLGKDKPAIVEAAAEQFAQFFGKYYDQHVQEKRGSPVIGFLIAGYGKDGVGRLLEFGFPGSRTPSNLPNDTHQSQGAVWRGQTDVISRLIKGYDPSIGNLTTFMAMEQPKQQQFIKELSGSEYNIPFQYLILQDGIDLALTLVQTTVDMQRFSFGTLASNGAIPGVGGSVDVLAITPAGLSWVKKKSLAIK